MTVQRSGQSGAHTSESLVGKYLIFELAEEEFGISVLQVKEIMKMQPITKVPKAPGSLKGVINLRGSIVPVMNLRCTFRMPEQEYTDRTCIIVVSSREDAAQPTGIIVDGVVEVLLLANEDIEAAPDFGQEEKAAYIQGMAKCKGGVKILLDIDEILSRQPTHLPTAVSA